MLSVSSSDNVGQRQPADQQERAELYQRCQRQHVSSFARAPAGQVLGDQEEDAAMGAQHEGEQDPPDQGPAHEQADVEEKRWWRRMA